MLHWVLEAVGWPQKREKVFLSDGRMFPDFQDVNL
jgi:hypothetical protein